MAEEISRIEQAQKKTMLLLCGRKARLLVTQNRHLQGLQVLQNFTAVYRRLRTRRKAERKEGKQLTDRDVNAYMILGNTFVLAGNVASKFPEDFAETVARWNPEDLDKIIDALEKERRKVNG